MWRAFAKNCQEWKVLPPDVEVYNLEGYSGLKTTLDIPHRIQSLCCSNPSLIIQCEANKENENESYRIVGSSEKVWFIYSSVNQFLAKVFKLPLNSLAQFYLWPQRVTWITIKHKTFENLKCEFWLPAFGDPKLRQFLVNFKLFSYWGEEHYHGFWLIDYIFYETLFEYDSLESGSFSLISNCADQREISSFDLKDAFRVGPKLWVIRHSSLESEFEPSLREFKKYMRKLHKFSKTLLPADLPSERFPNLKRNCAIQRSGTSSGCIFLMSLDLPP